MKGTLDESDICVNPDYLKYLYVTNKDITLHSTTKQGICLKNTVKTGVIWVS